MEAARDNRPGWRRWLGHARASARRWLGWAVSDPYPRWMQQRLRDRRRDYPPTAVIGLFSIITPVYDPPGRAFDELADSILRQDHADWEWVIVDNGSRRAPVLRRLAQLQRDPRVRLVRAPENLGIIRGMRLALERAHNRYILPVDHDDRLYPDALRVLAFALRAHGYPAVAYTDEDKLLPNGRAALPFFKPDWDPLLFLNCCYIAHLGVMDRQACLKAGVYTDAAAEGSPDGDAFCRLVAAGHRPLHVPEIVYSWRMHAGSTAGRGAAAKPYVLLSQYHVLRQHLTRLSLDDRLTVYANRVGDRAETWRVGRLPHAVGPLLPVLLGPADTRQRRRRQLRHLAACAAQVEAHGYGPERNALAQLLARFAPTQVVAVWTDDTLFPLTTDWPAEALALFDAVPNAVVAGGVVLNQAQRVLSAGSVFGFAGLAGCPFAGIRLAELQRGWGHFQRSVSAVSGGFFLARAGFLREVLADHSLDAQHPLLPAWLGASARRQRLRVLYTPHMVCQHRASRRPRPRSPSAGEVTRFLSEYHDLLRDDPTYSPFLGLAPGTAYCLATPAERAAVLNPWLALLVGPFAKEAPRLPDDHYPRRESPTRQASWKDGTSDMLAPLESGALRHPAA